jgi:uncharacterized protein (TIGR02271 family)
MKVRICKETGLNSSITVCRFQGSRNTQRKMIMQHTLAAVFNSQSQAQKASEALISSGLSRDAVHLTQSEDTAEDQAAINQERDRESSGSGIRSFFAELFGSGTNSDRDADLYSEAVMHGNYVLTVDVPDDDQVEEVAEVLDQYDPLDIDEQASQWKSGGWAAQDSMRQDMLRQDENPGLSQSRESGTNTTITGETQSRQNMSAAAATQQQSANEQQAIPVVQEELKVGKRAIQRGGVRVYQRVIENPVQESVSLREERVSVERRPVDQPADASALKEGTIEMRETAEEPVVEKVARVVEEVVIGKEVQQREQQINDTVRRTEVEVEQLSGSSASQSIGGTATRFSENNDDQFRNHWNSNYANTGGSYEDYAPAYQYGSSLSSDRRYTGRRWEDSESDVRRDWEAKNPGSTWEKMKGAVRHGWDSMTNK